MKKYEYILFDLDDTLINNLENVRFAYTKMLQFMGLEYTDEGFKKWYEFDRQFWIDFRNGKIIVPEEYQGSQKSYVQYVRSLRYLFYFDNKISLDVAFQINDIFLDALHEIVIPVEGAYETLSYLHDKYKLVIATNGPIEAAKSKLMKINCLDFIQFIFSADMTKARVTKPSREYFLELQYFLNFYKTNRMLIVGDSLDSDIRGGINAGIDSCWFNPNKEQLPEDIFPTMMIFELQELTRKL